MVRFFDFILSGLALLALTPLFAVVISILRLTGEGEIFFLQERVGKNGRYFQLRKFATMLKDSPNLGTGTVTIKNDPRILPFGRFLRKTKINELPQLLNVLIGEMSLIGPRPQTQRCFDAFSKDAQLTITQVKPGLSGLGSIIFSAEEELLVSENTSDQFYDLEIMPYKEELEKWFVERQSFAIYLGLIFFTVICLLGAKKSLIFNYYSSLPRPPKKLEELIR